MNKHAARRLHVEAAGRWSSWLPMLPCNSRQLHPSNTAAAGSGSAAARRTLDSDVGRLLVIRGHHLHFEHLGALSILPVVGARGGGHSTHGIPPVANLWWGI